MFIQNPVWKSVPATNLTAPVLEGTVLSKEGEVVWAPDGISSDATPYGVVTETINILPPTMLINVAVGGTIDLKLPGNEVAQDYPEDILTTLWDNIDFVRFAELDGQDIEPATRLEYFLKKATEGGGSASGVQLLEPITQDNSPLPPEGVTPQDYQVSVYVDDDQLNTNAFCLYGGARPVYAPSFMHIGRNGIIAPTFIARASIYPVAGMEGNNYGLTVKEETDGVLIIEGGHVEGVGVGVDDLIWGKVKEK